jgi:multiple sugar transport system permease protein
MYASGLTNSEKRWGIILCLPYLIGLCFFAAGPIFFSWIINFFRWDNISTPQFIGLGNWQRLLNDELFWTCCWNTFYFVIGVVPIGVFLSLMLALLVNRSLKGMGIFRTLYFTPVITSTAAVALVWAWFYDPNFGVLNFLLDAGARLLGLEPPDPIAWLNSPSTAMPAIIVMSIWKGLGYNMVIFLAALQNVPRQLYEAADIDGAGPISKFRHVTLPVISPVTFFVIIVSLIGAFQVFDQVYMMARDGRPANSTLTIVYYIYKNAFQFLEMGYASAVGTALFFVIFAVTLVQLWFQKKWVNY